MKQYDEEEMILRQITMGSNPYQAPQGYFDKLPGMVMQKVKTRHRRRTALRWAVAAVMTGCIATGGFLLHQQDLQKAGRHKPAQLLLLHVQQEVHQYKDLLQDHRSKLCELFC